jgi:hypothetical protein
MFYIYIKKEKPPDRMTLLMNSLAIDMMLELYGPCRNETVRITIQQFLASERILV